MIRVQQRINNLYDRPILLMWMTFPQINILDGRQILLICCWHRINNICQLARLDQVDRQIDFYSKQSSGWLKKCYEFAGSLTPRQDFQIHRQKFRPIEPLTLFKLWGWRGGVFIPPKNMGENFDKSLKMYLVIIFGHTAFRLVRSLKSWICTSLRVPYNHQQNGRSQLFR